MNFLHPVFTIVTIVLIVFSFMEVNNDRKYKSLWIVIAVMIILIGLRGVGADYPIYRDMYGYYGETLTYSEIFKRKGLEIEWLYLLIGKFFYDLGMPFFIFTFVLAIISIGLKQKIFDSDSLYPALSMLLYMFPSYFSADGGHMRQAVAMAIIFFSFYYIKKRRLLPFLFLCYIALGFHNSAFIFLIAYWLVLVPLNSTRIIILIVASILLSPFKIYESVSILEIVAPMEVLDGFQDYQGVNTKNEGSIKFMDLICVMYAYFVVTYDKEACNKIFYYEYMRNLGVMGICLYFIFRGSPIYSSRLIAYYMIMFTIIVPNVINSVQNLNIKKNLHMIIVAFVVFYYFVYAKMQAPRVGYSTERYNNFLWDF